jgi:hypothetical protein
MSGRPVSTSWSALLSVEVIYGMSILLIGYEYLTTDARLLACLFESLMIKL